MKPHALAHLNARDPDYRASVERQPAAPAGAIDARRLVFGQRPVPRAAPVVAYAVPVEVILALPTSSMFSDLIAKRRFTCGLKAMGKVFARGDRFFAIISFQGKDVPDLMFALDLWAWEQLR